MQVVIFSVLGTLAGVAAIVWIILCWRAWKEQSESRTRLQAAIEIFTKEATTIREHADAADKIIQGFTAMSKEQVDQLIKLQACVEKFTKAIFKDQTGDGFQEYDEASADEEYAIQEYMQSGMSREEAQRRFRAGNVYKQWRITG